MKSKFLCRDERMSTVVGSLGLLLVQATGRSLFRTLKPINGKTVAAEPSLAICGPEVQSLFLRNQVFEKAEDLAITRFGVYRIAFASLLQLRIQPEIHGEERAGYDCSFSYIICLPSKSEFEEMTADTVAWRSQLLKNSLRYLQRSSRKGVPASTGVQCR